MAWQVVEGVGSPVEEDVEGVGSPVEEEAEGAGVWLSFNIFSLNLFMYVSCDFLPRSCLLGSFVIFFHVLSMFYFKQSGKDC